ncbi:MAG: hypothetical protein MHPSP_003469 [Paramarteilia canceri]
MAFWDLNKTRKPPVKWNNSSQCDNCKSPFFWNISSLWERRQFFGDFRHHCRGCGKSLCKNCSFKLESLPHFGLEIPTFTCYECKTSFTEDELKSGISELQNISGSSSGLKLAKFGKIQEDDNFKEKKKDALVKLTNSFYQKIETMQIDFL